MKEKINNYRNKENEFLKCPKCGSGEFAEYAEQITVQRGVRVESSGKLNWDFAGSAEFTDDFATLYLQCDCGSTYRVRNGKLRKYNVR